MKTSTITVSELLFDVLKSFIKVSINGKIIYDDLNGNEESYSISEEYLELFVDSFSVNVVQFHHYDVNIKTYNLKGNNKMINMSKTRYKFYRNGEETKCISSYCGKKVIAVAHRHSADRENAKLGRDVAQAKVDVKVGKKRQARARNKVKEAEATAAAALAYLDQMREYEDEANDLLAEAEARLKDLLSK